MFIEIRDPATNELLGRFDPERDVIEFKPRHRKGTVEVSLQHLRRLVELAQANP